MEELKDNFLRNTLLKYAFHFLLFVSFFFVAANVFPAFQNFLMKSFSKIGYYVPFDKYSLFFMLIFVIVCYGMDFWIARKFGLKGYTIIYMVLLDICCLFVAIMVMVVLINIAFAKGGLASVRSLNDMMVLAVIIAFKNRSVELYLKHRKALMQGEQMPAKVV